MGDQCHLLHDEADNDLLSGYNGHPPTCVGRLAVFKHQTLSVRMYVSG